MKVFLRIVLFLAVLCFVMLLVVALSTFTAIPWFSSFAQDMMLGREWLSLAVAIALLVAIAAGVLALVLILSVPSRRRLYIVRRDAGNIEISRQSIESAAGACLDGIYDVKRYRVQAKGNMTPGKLKLHVQVEPRTGQVNMDALGGTVQQEVAAALSECLAINPKHVKVRIQTVEKNAGERDRRAQVPRVV